MGGKSRNIKILEKICNKCNLNLPVSDFNYRNGENGNIYYEASCKCCIRIYLKEYYENRRSKIENIEPIVGEIWVPVKNYETYYMVSSEGRVKSNDRCIKNGNKIQTRRGRIMNGVDDGQGYLNIKFSQNGKTIKYKLHRVILEAFVENPQNKPCVNHKNGNRSDNRIENLEWCTEKENVDHKYNVLNYKHPIGEQHKLSRPILIIFPNGSEIKINGISEAARLIKGDFRAISAVLTGRRKIYNGLKFKYAI